jgi:chorismate mutase/prephenate dehydratase
MMNDLKKIRAVIDKLDKQIIKNLNERGKLAQKIKKAKSLSNNSNIFRPEREAQILRGLEKFNDGPLSNENLRTIFREIISSCLSLEKKLKISCLGPEQSYSNIALVKFFGSSVDVKFRDSINSVFDDINHINMDFGIVPIENSNQGSIKNTIDRLIKEEMKICGEINLTIKHCLLSHSKNLDKIKKIYAHEQTFLQCDDWLTKNLPNTQRIFCSSNSAAAKKIKGTVNIAAIASKNCSAYYKIPILKNNIHDIVDNTTRFIVIGNHDIDISGVDKTSILVSVHNKAGALKNLLESLSTNKISMSKIESIPTKINNWEYMFLLDIDGHANNENVASALKDIKKKSTFYKFLGSYPKSI